MRHAYLLVLCLASGCATLGGAPDSAAPKAETQTPFNARLYRLAVGDRVRVDVFGEQDLSLEATIDSSGTINYPLLGRVPVLGMTPPELEMNLVRRLTGDYLVAPNLRVTVTQFRPIYIIGQITRAGAYPYVEGLTVEKAVAIAGGMTRLASERGIYILREHSPSREPATPATLVRPGDTIIVEERLF